MMELQILLIVVLTRIMSSRASLDVRFLRHKKGTICIVHTVISWSSKCVPYSLQEGPVVAMCMRPQSRVGEDVHEDS